MNADEEREVRFLLGHQLRSEVVVSSNADRREKKEEQNRLWESFKSSLGEWERQLQKIQAENGLCRTAQQRTFVGNQLRDLESSLQLQLSYHSDDLSACDLRLLHKEVARLSVSLGTVRSDLIPPNKFTFRRYRKAWNERMRLPRLDDEESSRHDGEFSETTKFSGLQLNTDTAIQGFTDVSISEAGGRRTIESLIAPQNQRSVLELASASSALLLKDITNCTLSLNGPSYKAIHLQDIHSTTVHIHLGVEGAIHVSGCLEMTLSAVFCHQLRLHESKKLLLTVGVGSSPILENCSGITFRITPDHRERATMRELLKEAKDFNWLRNDVPSPNFTVIEIGGERLCQSDGEGQKQVKQHPESTTTQTSRTSAGDPKAENDGSSDEDEL